MNGNALITQILTEDKKQNTYKIALIRAINDVVIEYPTLKYTAHSRIAIPLKNIANWWLAYYWAFVDNQNPIWQSVSYTTDMSFRNILTEFRLAWQRYGGKNHHGEGYKVRKEINKYPETLVDLYKDTIKAIQKGVSQPIIYAGTEQIKHFDAPTKLLNLTDAIPLPSANHEDLCFIIEGWLWQTFEKNPVGIESMCVDAWCLFIQDKAHHLNNQKYTHADIYPLLTTRPS